MQRFTKKALTRTYPAGSRRTKATVVARGARGLEVPEGGLRPASFAYLREGGKPIPALPVTLALYPEGKLAIVDGRHRILLARERGESHVHGRIVAYGPRLGVLWSYTGLIPV